MPFGLGFFATAGVSAGGGAYELIETQLLSSSATSITFSSIPQDYKHLQIRTVVRGSGSATNTDFLQMKLNGSATNYTYHYLRGNGTTVTSSGGTGETRGLILQMPNTLAATGAFGVAVVDILDYTNTNKNTTTRALHGWTADRHLLNLYSSLWINTAAVSSIELFSGQNMVSGSRFSLYGIKG